MAEETEELAAALERLMLEPSAGVTVRTAPAWRAPADDEPQGPDEPTVVDEPVVIERPPSNPTGVDAAPLRRELDELRDQLDQAFGEVISQSSRLELRLASLVQRVEAQADGTEAAKRGLAHMETGVTDLARTIDRRLTALAASMTEALERPIPKPEFVLDERFALLARTVEQLLDNAQARPADIANVRQDIEALSEVVSRQAKALEELASSFDWIKERLLPR